MDARSHAENPYRDTPLPYVHMTSGGKGGEVVGIFVCFVDRHKCKKGAVKHMHVWFINDNTSLYCSNLSDTAEEAICSYGCEFCISALVLKAVL